MAITVQGTRPVENSPQRRLAGTHTTDAIVICVSVVISGVRDALIARCRLALRIASNFECRPCNRAFHAFSSLALTNPFPTCFPPFFSLTQGDAPLAMAWSTPVALLRPAHKFARPRSTAGSCPKPRLFGLRVVHAFGNPESSRSNTPKSARFAARVRLARVAAASSDDAFWDNAEDTQGQSHRGYAPVPGFGEYYTPPKPAPSPAGERGGGRRGEGTQGTPPPSPRPRSKLLEEPNSSSVLAPPPVGAGERYDNGHDSSYGNVSRMQTRNTSKLAAEIAAVRGARGRDAQPVTGPTTNYAYNGGDNSSRNSGHSLDQVVTQLNSSGNTTALVTLDAPYGTQPRGMDPELFRLRRGYLFLTKMIGWLKFLLPVTGGLACWVAAGASLGGVFALMIPSMVNAVNVFAFVLCAVVGVSACLGAYLLTALVGRALRSALFGDGGVSPINSPMTRNDTETYQTHPGLLAAARAQSEQETNYRNSQMQQARQNEMRYEEYQRVYSYRVEQQQQAQPVSFAQVAQPNPSTPPRRNTSTSSTTSTTPGRSAVSFQTETYVNPSGSWDDSNGYYQSGSYEDVAEYEPFAARTPPKRARVDLPIETLMGLGGESLSAVGSEWNTQKARERAAAGGGKLESAGSRGAPVKTVFTNSMAAEAARDVAERKQTGSSVSAGAPAARAYAARAEPVPAGTPREPVAAPPPPKTAAPAPTMRGGKVDWDPASLMKDMGFASEAQDPAPTPTPALTEEPKNGGWFAGLRSLLKDDPVAPIRIDAPPPPAQKAKREVDPVLAMLGGGAGENPNAARAAAAAKKKPSGEYYLTPPKQTKEQFEDMQKRRDDWNKRVRRTVRPKTEAGEADDEA